MISALVLALMLGGAEPQEPSPREDRLANLIRTACIETGLQRDAFERTARAHRWRAARMTSSSGSQGWMSTYRVGDAIVQLAGVPLNGQIDPALASMCMVSVTRPGTGWRSDLAALATDLGMEAEGRPDLPGSGEMLVWSKFGSQTLTASYANDTVAVTLSRQIVTHHEQTPPSESR